MSHSLFATQIFVTWLRPYFIWQVSTLKNWDQTDALLFNDYNYEIQLLFLRNVVNKRCISLYEKKL